MFETRAKYFRKNFVYENEVQIRHDFAVNLRKSKRLENYKKRRYENTPENFLKSVESNAGNFLGQAEYEKLVWAKKTLESKPSKPELLKVLSFLRVLSSSDECYLDPIGKLVPIISEYLNLKYDAEILEESTWILCNLASGSEACTHNLYTHGCIEGFFIVLSTKSSTVRENALWGLSNMIADSPIYSDMILEKGIIKKIYKICKLLESKDLYNVIAWTLKNICLKIQTISIDNIELVVAILAKLIDSQAQAVLNDALCCVALVAAVSDETIDCLIEQGLIAKAVAFKDLSPYAVLDVLGNVCAGTRRHTDYVISLGVLDVLHEYIDTDNIKILIKVYWVLSNIATGTIKIIETLSRHPIFNKTILAIGHINEKVQIAASFYLVNYFKMSRSDMIHKVVDLGLLSVLEKFSIKNDIQFIYNILDIYDIIVGVIGYENLSTHACFDIVYSLSVSHDKKISARALSIINATEANSNWQYL
jgi:hypothetical protein